MSTRMICRLLLMCGLVAGLSMSGSVAEATCSKCDFSDGSCCDALYSGCNCLELCPGTNPLPCGTTCAGSVAPCRKPDQSCVYGWDEECCVLSHGTVDWSCPAAAEEEVESENDAVCEGDDKDSKTCPADKEIAAKPSGQEDLFCFCPGGICCGSTCFPGAHCCIAGVGYECCDDSQCTPPEECVGRHCVGGPQ